MANEFVARRGIIAQSGGARITGSLLVSGTIDATGYNIIASSLTGSFSGSIGSAVSASYALTASYVSGAASDWDSIANKPTDLVSSSTQVTAFLPNGTVSSSAQYPGWVTASSQIDYNQIQNKLSGVVSSSTQVAPLLPNGTVSSSTQTVANIAGQAIAPSQVSSSGGLSGSFIQVSGNGIIGGNLNVTGTITATSQSIQYISSSQLNVATNTIIVNTDNSLRFGGLSVVDSGSIGKSGSLFWDSLGDRWIYEDVSGGTYTSAILVAGPKNVGTTGNERGLLEGRVPVASGDDHIDTAAVSSSIRVDFPSRLTHIEAGLFITGNLTANGTVTLQDIPSSSAQVKILLPNGTVSSSAQYPGWVTASSQVDITTTTGYSTFSSSIATKNNLQDVSINALNSATSSYAINATIQSQLAGVVSSSTQVQPLLPVGTVSSSAQYPGWVTSSAQIQLASITGTTFATSDFVFPQKLTVSGVLSGSTSAFINNALYSGSAVTGIVGPVNNQVVATLPTANYDGVFFDYVVKDGTNYRTGTVMVVANGTNVEFTDTSTADIGNTAQVSFVVDIVGGLIRLKLTNISGTWTFKTVIRAF